MKHRARPIIITGAAGGIGKPLITELQKYGYRNVVAIARDGYVSNHRVVSKLLNLAHVESVMWLRDEIAGLLNEPIWGLINLAGKSHAAPSWSKEAYKTTLDDLRDNMLTTANMCSEFAPQMRAALGGRIINIGSIVAHQPRFGASAYAASKAWVEGYTRALALELAPKSVTANCIALGYFNAGMIHQLDGDAQESTRATIPLRRFGEVEEIAALVDYLLSDASTYMTGQTLHLNGGAYT